MPVWSSRSWSLQWTERNMAKWEFSWKIGLPITIVTLHCFLFWFFVLLGRPKMLFCFGAALFCVKWTSQLFLCYHCSDVSYIFLQGVKLIVCIPLGLWIFKDMNCSRWWPILSGILFSLDFWWWSSYGWHFSKCPQSNGLRVVGEPFLPALDYFSYFSEVWSRGPKIRAQIPVCTDHSRDWTIIPSIKLSSWGWSTPKAVWRTQQRV